MATKSSQSNPSRNSPGSLAHKTDTNPNLYNWIFGENIILVQIVFLKFFTMIYLAAFTSIYVQIPGLYGKDGMLPVNNYLNKVSAHVGANKYNVLPTLFWLSEDINKYILYLFPSLQNFQAEENLFHVICLVNIVLCFCILFDTNFKIFFNFWTFFVLWISYLSIYLVGQTFLSFQWDIFILETGFLAMFFVPNKQEGYFVIDQLSVVTRELLRWLMFRFMFSNGVVKLLSADHTWWNLSALDYHFESQPLPTPFAKWWHYLPTFIKKFGVANMFIVEIFLPMLFYCPIRTVRLFSGVYQIPLQLSIILTGNYNWFNLHTIVLCIPLFDDKFIKRYTPNLIQRCLGISNIKVYQPNPHKDLLPEKVGWILSGVCMAILFALFQVYFPFDLEGSIKTNFDMKYLKNILINSYFLIVPVYLAIAFGIFNLVRYSFKPTPKKIRPSTRTTKMTFASIFFAVVFLASIFPFFHGIDAKMDLLPAAIVGFQPLYHMIQSFSIVNSYGLFRVMTGVGGRPELVVQGSYDKQEWLDYGFWYKPGKLEEKCKFNIPHQPRLDWQMWFAALGNINQNPWLINMIGRLFSNSPGVVELIKRNPFEEKPPSYIRIMQYKYTFANEKSEKEWQILNLNGEEYLPAISRSDPTINKYLRDAGFQAIELQSGYPVHPWQGIPVVRIVLTVLVVNIVMNFVRNKRRN